MTENNGLAIIFVQRAIDICPHGNDLYPTLQSFLDRLKGDMLS